MGATLCLSFDNMGQARQIIDERASRPDPNEPGLATGYPRILDLLDDLGLKGTFFVEGWNCLHHADRVLELARRGHEVGVHGWVHERYKDLSKARAEQVLYDATAAFRLIGLDPKGFRAPGGYLGDHGLAPLIELGFSYDSSGGEAGSRDAPSDVIPQPSFLCPEIVNIPFRWRSVDTFVYRTDTGPRTTEHLLDLWDRGLRECIETDGVYTVIFHAFFSGVSDERMATMRRFLERAIDDPLVEVTTPGRLAARMHAERRASVG